MNYYIFTYHFIEPQYMICCMFVQGSPGGQWADLPENMVPTQKEMRCEIHLGCCSSNVSNFIPFDNFLSEWC